MEKTPYEKLKNRIILKPWGPPDIGLINIPKSLIEFPEGKEKEHAKELADRVSRDIAGLDVERAKAEVEVQRAYEQYQAAQKKVSDYNKAIEKLNRTLIDVRNLRKLVGEE